MTRPLILSSVSPRAVATVTFPDHAPSVLYSRCSALSGNRSFLAAWSDPWIRQRSWALRPFAVLLLPRRCRRMFPCRRAHMSFSAHPPRCFLFEGSTAIKRLSTHCEPSRIATVDRGCADQLLGFTGGQAVRRQGYRDLSPDFVLPAASILPWASSSFRFRGHRLRCARSGTTPNGPSISAGLDLVTALPRPDDRPAIRSWAWRWAFCTLSEMHGPDVRQ